MEHGYQPRWESFEALANMKTRNAAAQKIKGVLDLSHGGHYRQQPHTNVLEAMAQAVWGSNLLGYLKMRAQQEGTDLLDFLHQFKPPAYYVDLEQAYRYRYARTDQSLSFRDFLDNYAAQRYHLAHYPTGTLGHPESLSILREFFIQAGIPAHNDLVIMGHGFKMLYMAAAAAIFTRAGTDGHQRPQGGYLVLPEGHYHSLVIPLDLFGIQPVIIKKMRGDQIRPILSTCEYPVRAIVLTSISIPEGEILSNGELMEIAEVILEYNQSHPDHPVYVILDELYKYTILNPKIETMPSFASMVSARYGSVHPYTISIMSPSKTFAFPSARIGFATCGDHQLLLRMGDWIRQIGEYHACPVAEVGAAAAFALTPTRWIEENNAYFRQRVVDARQHAFLLNQKLGWAAIHISNPDGGWYLSIEVDKASIPERHRQLLKTADDWHIYLIYYGHGQDNTGVITYSGAVLGYQPDRLVFRVSLAVQIEEVPALFERLYDALSRLQMMTQEELNTILNRGRFQKATKTTYVLAGQSPL